MPVLLSERAVCAMLATLQSYLNDELTYIDLERDDGDQLQPVEAWYCFDRGLDAVPERAEVQVYRDAQGVAFPRWDRNLSTFLSTATAVLASETFMSVALVWANREGLSRSEMEIRAWRYEAALLRVMRDNPELGQGSIGVVRVSSVETNAVARVADAKSWGKSVMRCSYTQDEDETTEGQAAGGIPPSCITEQDSTT